MWNLKGKRVKGIYIGMIEVTGVVEETYANYGRGVTHHVILDEGFSVFDGRISRPKGDVVLIDANDVEVLK